MKAAIFAMTKLTCTSYSSMKFPVDEFYEKLQIAAYKEKAYYEFALCKQLQVTGFPTLLLQVSESKFYLLARGFTKYENLKPVIDGVLEELKKDTNTSN